MIKGFILIVLLLVFVRKYAILQRDYLLQRESFVKILSHDLRISTLAQIRGVELLQKEGAKSVTQREMLLEIDNSCRYSLEMINMLLMSYRFENGEDVLKMTNFSFSKLVYQLFKDMNVLCEEKRIKIILTPNVSDVLCADREAIQRLMRNLLQNAVLNCSRGGVVEVGSFASGGSFEIFVKYSGYLLSSAECKDMFAYKRRFSLVGENIKMYLCKKIVDSHRGKIWVESDEELGNIYRVFLPITNTTRKTRIFTPSLAS